MVVLAILCTLSSSSGQGEGSYIDTHKHQILSRWHDVASSDVTEDRSRVERRGRGFWGQMASSRQNERTISDVQGTEMSDERNKKPKEQIMARTKTDSSLSLQNMKSLIKRVKNGKKKFKPRKKQFRSTGTVREENQGYHSDDEYDDYTAYDANNQMIRGEESRRQSQLGFM